MQKAAALDVGGKALDRDAGLDLADIAFVKDELVEGDGLRRGEGEFLSGFGHRRRLLGLRFRGRRETLSRQFPFTLPLQTSSSKPLRTGSGCMQKQLLDIKRRA